MGISGLLPLLKEIQVQRNVSEFKGQRLAIDGYVWLHKGAFGCAEDLVRGVKTTKFVDYAMHRIRMLRHYGVIPMMVFDGGPLPAKKGTEEDRAKRREESLAKANALAAQGRSKDARDIYTKCVDVTPEMAYQLIKALQAENVEYVVAPYEADAQLAYLEREGIVDGIITEDSDLLVFGCRQVIYRLDGNGACMSIDRERFGAVKSFNLTGWTDTEFRRMAILAGCDYLDSIPGIGIKKAHGLLRKHKTVEKVVLNIRLEGSLPVPRDYIPNFQLAELVFLHQRVYDPRSKRLVTLLPLPEDGLDEVRCRYIGHDVPPHVAEGMATGRLHPETYEPIKDLWPDFKPQQNHSSFVAAKGPMPAAARGSALFRPALANSTRQLNSGPLDAFFAKTPIVNKIMPQTPWSAPTSFLPKPVGVRGSGPARLSDLTCSGNGKEGAGRLRNRDVTNATELKSSKFFGIKKQAQPRVQTLRDDMVFDDDMTNICDDNGIEKKNEMDVDNVSSPIRSEQHAVEERRSPSPVCSSLASPDADCYQSILTSPDASNGPGGRLSSPSPLASASQDKRSHQVSPLKNHSQTKKRRLSLSRMRYPLPPPLLDGPNLNDVCPETQWDSSSVHEDWSVHDAALVAPGDEEAKLELQSRESAKKIAQGWKAKWSFDAQLSGFGKGGRTTSNRKPLVARAANITPVRTPTPQSKVTKGKPKLQPVALQSRPIAAMRTADMVDGMSDVVDYDNNHTPMVPGVLAPASQTPPGSLTGSQKLQRFRFQGIPTYSQ